MRRIPAIVSAMLVVAGLVWIGQGTSLIQGGSFMVGDPLWAWIGLGCVLAGVGLGAWVLSRRRRA